jgi:ABC-2 type transport system permease protein
LWIVIPVTLPAVVASSLRTLLQQADRVYLLPAESVMFAYFRQSFLHAAFKQTIWTLLALLLIWPLYLHCTLPDAQDLPAMAFLFILIKALNLASSWQETRFVYARDRMISIWFRWIGTALLLVIAFSYGIIPALILIFAMSVVWIIATRTVPRYLFGWDTLIEQERRQKKRWYIFFSWFIDVPKLPVKVNRLPLLTRPVSKLSFGQNSAYVYLYALTFLRTEWLSIILRLTGGSILIQWILSSSLERLIVYILTVFIAALQLSAFESSHRDSFWPFTYPIAPNLRILAAVKLIRNVLMAVAVIASIPLVWRNGPLYLLVPILAVFAVTIYCHRNLRRKYERSLQA